MSFNFRTFCSALLATTSVGCIDRLPPIVASNGFPIREELSRLVTIGRPFEARLSGMNRWVPCELDATMASAGLYQCRNYTPSVDAMAKVSAAIDKKTKSLNTADAAWATASIDVLAIPRVEQVERLIRTLEEQVHDSIVSPGMQNDLAVAYLMRSVWRDDPLSAFQALEHIERASQLDAKSSIIQFNHALILEHLHLLETARVEWDSLRTSSGAKQWTIEANEHLRRLTEALVHNSYVGKTLIDARDVAANPQGAREWALNDGLDAWAASATDLRRKAALATLAQIGSALANSHTDSSVMHVTQELHSVSGGALHAAVEDYVQASRGFTAGRVVQYRQQLTNASRIFRANHMAALTDWTNVMLALVSINEGRFDSANVMAAAVLRSAELRTDWALAGRALTMLGLSTARQGREGRSSESYARAATLFGRIGERANEGSMVSQRGDVEFVLGQDDMTLGHQFHALQLLANTSRPSLRAGPLLGLGRQLTELGLPHAGLAVLREASASGQRSSREPDHPEALMRLASAEFALNRTAEGEKHLAQASQILKTVADSAFRARLTMEFNHATAKNNSALNAKTAVERLDSVSKFFERSNILYDAATPLVEGGERLLVLGDTAGATERLLRASELLDAISVSADSAASKRNVAETKRDLFNMLVEVSLARRDTMSAFRFAENSRGHMLKDLPLVRPGESMIAYTSLVHALLIWTIDTRGMKLKTVGLDSGTLSRMVLQTDGGRYLVDSAAIARRLYAVLLQPIQEQIKDKSHLIVIPDGAIGLIPFEALRTPDGKFLIERTTITYRRAATPGYRRSSSTGRMVLVGDPAFDPQKFPTLASLRWAKTESDELSALYHHAAGAVTRLTGSDATRINVERALQQAWVFHFAGHAQLVDRSPDRSHLVLASVRSTVENNVLSAGSIRQMNLGHLDLVVLSSCGTSQAASLRKRSTNSLSQAFLAAGARRVVSSRWAVDDSETSTLMIAFHKRILSGVSANVALRDAQVAALQDRRASGGNWASFRLEER